MSTPSERDWREAERIVCENTWGWLESEGVSELTDDQKRHVEVLARALAARSAVPDKVLDAYEDVVRSVDALPVDLGEHLRCIGSTLAASCVQNLKDAMKCLRLEKEAAEAAARGGER